MSQCSERQEQDRGAGEILVQRSKSCNTNTLFTLHNVFLSSFPYRLLKLWVMFGEWPFQACIYRVFHATEIDTPFLLEMLIQFWKKVWIDLEVQFFYVTNFLYLHFLVWELREFKENNFIKSTNLGRKKMDNFFY